MRWARATPLVLLMKADHNKRLCSACVWLCLLFALSLIKVDMMTAEHQNSVGQIRSGDKETQRSVFVENRGMSSYAKDFP